MTVRREPRLSILLVATALVVATLPRAGAGEFQGDMETNSTTTPTDGVLCCPHDQTCPTQPTPETAPAPTPPINDDCCPIGCDDCLLPCCAGPVSLQGTSAPPVGPDLGWPTPLPRYNASFCSVDPPTIYRPPRS